MHGQRKQKSFERSERLFFEIGHNSYQIQRYLAFLRNFKNYDISRPIFVPIFHNLQTSAFFQAFFVSLEDKFSSFVPFFYQFIDKCSDPVYLGLYCILVHISEYQIT